MVSLSLSLNAKQLTNEEKGKIWEDTVEHVLKELAFILAEYFRVYWSVRPPPIEAKIVARDDRKGPEPKPDFVVVISINHRLTLVLLIECHNYAMYLVSIEVADKNTVKKFARFKEDRSRLRFVVGHVLYTTESEELLKSHNIQHVWIDRQVLSYDGDDFKSAVQQLREQLLQQLAPHLVMHLILRYIKPKDRKRLDRIDDLDEFKRTLGRLICKRLKEATATQVGQLIEQQEEKVVEELRSSLAELYPTVYPSLYQHIDGQYPCSKDRSRLALSGSSSGGLDGFTNVCAMGSGVEPY